VRIKANWWADNLFIEKHRLACVCPASLSSLFVRLVLMRTEPELEAFDPSELIPQITANNPLILDPLLLRSPFGSPAPLISATSSQSIA
jgi:hypothetical protein